jgi:zinc transport system substrate-binding protein
MKMACLRLPVFLAALTMFTAAPGDASEGPQVVATVAPVHSLTAVVMEGVGEPHLLLPPQVSPHDYALRPSDARAIADADLVIWVGESLETFLARVMAERRGPVLELLEAPGVDPVEYGEETVAGGHAHSHDHAHAHGHADDHAHDRDAHAHAHGHSDHASDHEHAHAHDHGHAHDHDHTGLDPHVWLDPVRGQAMAAAIADALAEQDSANAERYQANAERLIQALNALDEEVRGILTPHGDKPVLTFHDGYSYFMGRYGLSLAGIFTLDPQRRPGARTMAQLREMAREEGIVCVFAEPQFDDRMVRRLAEETGVRLGYLDPYGVAHEPGPDLFPALIRANAGAVAECLEN